MGHGHVYVRTEHNQKMGSERRTELKIWPSGAKYLEEPEPDVNVKTSLAPTKSTENAENPISKTENFPIFIFSFFWCFWCRQASFKAEILTAPSSRSPQASCASEKFAK